ncbi:Uncharacterised protein [Mycobacterium tuberculosis]|uniref:Uncharacterized protein n=1 Tax=Mycobacterium tuberculosis TaxID=1773 RepID=A0A655AKL8_MYCTX|nr:Uncharacterised protein [Mycobacterium tuberculosis]CKT50635.1 Uncharacterised protein [Mycobacterium tuberculosis]
MVAIVSTRPSLGDRPDERPRTTRPGSRWRRPVASPNSGSCRDHRGHRRRRSGFTAARYARCDRRRARRRRQPARPELGARRRHRYHAGGRQHRRRSQRDPPFDRARVGPSRPRAVSAGQARHRTTHHRRLLLRLRRARAVHARGLGGAGKADAPDRQGRPAVRPAGLRIHRTGPRRAGQRALQAGTRRRQIG